jgi:DNA-binding MarR family transcriptional regulator
MAVVANIYRAAAAVRQHLENSVLRGCDLTWTSFVVLWVVWIWGESETRHVAEEAGISKGTLTGVARTLESRGLIKRVDHAGWRCWAAPHRRRAAAGAARRGDRATR